MAVVPHRAFLLALVAAAASLASLAGAQTATAGACLDSVRPQIAADAAVMKDANEALRAQGFAGLASRRDKLQAVLDHIPAGAQVVEVCEGRYLVHASTLADGILMAATLSAEERKRGGARNVTVEGAYPYVTAALYLGSLDTERRDYDRAAQTLRRGLALDPQSVALSSELSTALSQAHHQEEALAVADKALSNPLLAPKDQALLQRRRGFALTEMRRLDEAEAAYRTAAKLNPADQNASRELTYIAQQRAGAPPGAITATAPASKVGKANGEPSEP